MKRAREAGKERGAGAYETWWVNQARCIGDERGKGEKVAKYVVEMGWRMNAVALVD